MTPRLLVPFALTLMSPCSGLAVSPLVTDDADTVERGRVQLNAGWQFSRTAPQSAYHILVNPVIGLTSCGELGGTFGYQWQDGPDSMPDQSDAQGITDLTLATKWRLWSQTGDRFKLSARFDLKLPTASERRGLGSGDVDAGAVLIGTRCWGDTCLDWNVGYTFIDASDSEFGDDHWFLGQAVRHELTGRWTLIGETYAALPHGNGGSTIVQFDGGAQFSVRENLLLSALIGTAVGRDSPDVTSYLGFTWLF